MARFTKAPAATTPAREPKVQRLETYGLEALGYGDGLDNGDWLADQIFVESQCFRIGHKPVEGGLGKYGHYRRLVELLWNNPDGGSQKRFVWNSWAERMFRTVCEWDEVGIAGPASAGKSDPLALWAVVNYMVDPTHTMVLVMSTSLKGAKKRIWKTLLEYWNSLPEPRPGKKLDATNEIKGFNYNWEGYGESSGLYLLATEKSSEATALDKLIGIKAPATGTPGSSFEELLTREEYKDLQPLLESHGEDYVRDLIHRLQVLSEDRIGKIIVIVDEATGAAEGVLNALMANMKPGNAGHVQIVFLGNPASHFDSFGLFCEPEKGWDNVTLNDTEWKTKSGGICTRFNAEENPRITENDEKLFWMPTKKVLEEVAKQFGRDSLYYYRMVLGFWAPGGLASGVYSEADFISTRAMETSTTWGFHRPVRISSLDPSFCNDGDRASCTFWSLGRTPENLHVLHRDEVITIKADINDLTTPVPIQLVRSWRRECEKRGVEPSNACFDSTGGGITFHALVQSLWSSQVQAISSGGKATREAANGEKDGDGNTIMATERYANKATQIWYGAHPFLRSGQIRGVTADLAKEICSRQHEKGNHGDGRTLKVENKRLFKAREKKSPDDSDSFFLGIEHARTRHGFKPDTGSVSEAVDKPRGSNTWSQFVQKARRITTKRGLSR